VALAWYHPTLILGDHTELWLPWKAVFSKQYLLSKDPHSYQAYQNTKNYHYHPLDYVRQMHLQLYHHHHLLSFKQVQILLPNFYLILTFLANLYLSYF